MKIKKILFFIILGITVLLSGCTEPPVIEDYASHINEMVVWVESQIPSTITSSIELPTEHPTFGGDIVWVTYDEEYITAEGGVVLPDGVQEVMIGYTITYQELVRTNILTITLIGKTIEDVAQLFEAQFNPIISRNYNVNTTFFDGFTVTWTSNNEDVFTNTGTYIQPINATPFSIQYQVTLMDQTETFTLELTARGKAYVDKVNDISAWITENYITSRVITSELQLPTAYEEYNATIEWVSSNQNVISKEGVVTAFPFDRYVSLMAVIHFDTYFFERNFSLIVKAQEVSTKAEKVEALLDAIAVEETQRVTFEYYTNITQSFNHLMFYQNVAAPVTQRIMPLGGSRPGTKLTSFEYVTIHDTANNNGTAGAQTHANLLYNGYDAASWHFAIDSTGAWQSVPTDEVAYHAGDGSRSFAVTNTGVTATGEYPVITISMDGYYEFNGVKSLVKAPTNNGITLTTSHITPSGLYTEIGLNGNYYIGTTYFNSTYQKISNGGGNRNSVGIETCVDNGTDYMQVLRHTAKLTAELLIAGGKGVDRVMQHNNFSGKDCPLTARRTNYWDAFLDMVSLEMYAKTQLADVNFTWTSLTPTLLNDNGRIVRSIGTATEVSYSVSVSYDSTSFSRTYSTILG